MNGDREQRVFSMDRMAVERRADGVSRIVGHASVFNQPVAIGRYFRETVAPGAFRRAIADDDVRALFNHDPNIVLGRNRAGTLKLSEDEVGLVYEIAPPDTQAARDLLLSIERGDITQSSFGFRVRKESWDETQDPPLRTLIEVELFDVSPVTFAAYPTTDAGVRALEAWRKTHPAPGAAWRVKLALREVALL